MNYAPEQHHTVGVHVESAAPGALDTRPCTYRAVYQTIVLTAGDNGKELWAASDDREYALVQALDDDITIARASSDSVVPSAGYTLPVSDTGPVEMRDSGVAYCGNATGTFSGAGESSRVAVAAFYRVSP